MPPKSKKRAPITPEEQQNLDFLLSCFPSLNKEHALTTLRAYKGDGARAAEMYMEMLEKANEGKVVYTLSGSGLDGSEAAPAASAPKESEEKGKSANGLTEDDMTMVDSVTIPSISLQDASAEERKNVKKRGKKKRGKKQQAKAQQQGAAVAEVEEDDDALLAKLIMLFPQFEVPHIIKVFEDSKKDFDKTVDELCKLDKLSDEANAPPKVSLAAGASQHAWSQFVAQHPLSSSSSSSVPVAAAAAPAAAGLEIAVVPDRAELEFTDSDDKPMEYAATLDHLRSLDRTPEDDKRSSSMKLNKLISQFQSALESQDYSLSTLEDIFAESDDSFDITKKRLLEMFPANDDEPIPEPEVKRRAPSPTAPRRDPNKPVPGTVIDSVGEIHAPETERQGVNPTNIIRGYQKELDELRRQRKVMLEHAFAASSSKDYNGAKRFLAQANEMQARIEELRGTAVEKAAKDAPSCAAIERKIDLHGYQPDECDTILANVFLGDSRPRGVVQVITGKGLHSREGIAVLQPHVENWLRNNKIRFRYIAGGFDVLPPKKR